MLSFFLGFAQIKADDIPEGVMPKRAVVGTGVSTSNNTPATSTSQATTPATSTTPTSDAGSTSTPDTSATPTTPVSSTADTSSSDDTSSAASASAASSSASSQQSSAQQSTSIPTTVAVTTTNSDGSTFTSHIATSTLAPASSPTSNTNAVQTETGKSGHNIVKIGSSTIDPSTLSHKTTITSALLGKETHQSIYTSFWTSDGQVYSSLVTTDAVVTGTTGYATATIVPSLANGGGNGSNLSTNAKKVIGGVVGGIGGAILIGGLAFVAWRLWGKKRQAERGDEVFGDSQDGSSRQEKRDTVGSSSYGSGNGLDRYANPNGAVNTASNF